MNILEIHLKKGTLANAYFIEGHSAGEYAKKLFSDSRYEIFTWESGIGIAEIRALKEKMLLSSHAGKRRIMLISAEDLRWEAKAALLKVIEEPPPHTHMMLYGSTRAVLSPTLASRLIPVSVSGPYPDALPFTQEADTFLLAPFSKRKKILDAIETIADVRSFLDALEKRALSRRNGTGLDASILHWFHRARAILSHPAPSLSLLKDYILVLP